MQGPPACGHVPTLTNIYPIYGLNRRGEGTSLLSHLAILKGDGQHRTTKIPVSWFTLGSKPPSQLVSAGPVTRHNELKLTTKSPKNKASKPTDNGNPLFRQHRISIRTKINMYRALVVPVLLYGSEAWATTLADRRRLDVFDMRCQRRLLRVFWQQHVSNQSIRERTRQPTASSLLRQRRLRWFGHLHRMPSCLPVRRVFDFNPTIHGWKRPRGRPKTRWADSVKHDLHSAGLDSINAAQLVNDRPQWKAFVCGLPTLEPEHGP